MDTIVEERKEENDVQYYAAACVNHIATEMKNPAVNLSNNFDLCVKRCLQIEPLLKYVIMPWISKLNPFEISTRAVSFPRFGKGKTKK